MNIITSIFFAILGIIFFLVAIAIFIQSSTDLWISMKPEIKNWLRGTRLEMWYSNHKNKVKILTKDEYDYLVKAGKIKCNITIDE
jgi:hypothetical protein